MQEKQVVVIQDLPKREVPPHGGQIKITVEDPQMSKSDTISHFTYQIVGVDNQGEFNVRRRYHDFDLLRKRLAQRWLGIYIPPISGKRTENNPLFLLKFFQKQTNEARYADTRKRFLRYFCQGIAIRPFLFYCDIFQLFIRGGPDFQSILSSNLNKEYNFILNAYETSFNTLVLNNKMEMSQLVAISEKHYKVIKESQTVLQNICDKVFKASECRQNFNNQFNNVMTKTIPEYEQRSLLNHFGKDRQKLILTKTNTFEQEMIKFKEINSINPLENFLQMIMYQIREVKSFMEAIEGRREAEKRMCQIKQKLKQKQNQKLQIQSGKISIKTIFKKGSKDLQINELTMKMEVLKNEFNCLEKMMVMMIVNTNYELEQFRLRRGKQYAQMFKKVAEEQLTEIIAYQQLLQIPLASLP